MVKMQYNATIGEWMTDNGGEYVDKDYVKLLKDEGIESQQSIPAQPQMNGRAECFNCTIDEKAESMHHQACLPDSWWEFSILHVNYLYNCTPVRCETESVPDDDSDAPFTPPHDSIIPQGDEERLHDDTEPQRPPQSLPQKPQHAPGEAQHGNEPPRHSE